MLKEECISEDEDDPRPQQQPSSSSGWGLGSLLKTLRLACGTDTGGTYRRPLYHYAVLVVVWL